MEENNMNRGFCQEYHSNGEPKTWEEKSKEIAWAVSIGIFIVVWSYIGLMFWATM